MTGISILGFLASGVTMVSFLPQVVKTWRSGSSEDLSVGMYLLLITGAALWLTYGVLTDDVPIIVTNIVLVALLSSVLAQMMWHRRRPTS